MAGIAACHLALPKHSTPRQDESLSAAAFLLRNPKCFLGYRLFLIRSHGGWWVPACVRKLEVCLYGDLSS